MEKLTRSQKVKNTLRETRKRRMTQTCRVITCKINYRKLSHKQQESLRRLFLEAKWFMNAIIASDHIFSYMITGNTIPVRCKNDHDEWITEQRPIIMLSRQMEQGLLQECKDAIHAMKAKRDKAIQAGRKPLKLGRLKFRKEITEIPLKQFGVTYRFTGANTVHIQNIPGVLHLEGADRLNPDHSNNRTMLNQLDILLGFDSKPVEYANAKLLHKEDGYYLAITTYEDSEQYAARYTAHESIRHHIPASGSQLGIDAGQSDQLTCNNGKAINIYVTESLRLKKAARQVARRVKYTNGWWSALHVLKLEYLKETRQRKALADQTFHDLHAQAIRLYVQDEQISKWKRKTSKAHGSRKIHHGILGRLYAKFKQDPYTIMLDKWQPTTAWCPHCGRRTKHPPGKETYRCAYCGYTNRRDPHAAGNMIILARHPLTRHELYQTQNIPVGPYGSI